MHRRRTTSRGTSPATKISHQPPRLLIVHIAVPSWDDICPNLCEALQNFFSIACSLMGPSRMSLFSLYTVQNQHECVLPFVQVRGNFVRLQACISELRTLQVEGCYRPSHTLLPLAVEDGLQQFKQYSSHMATSAAQPLTSLEITVLTSQPGKEVVKELEEGLKDINLLSVRRLQVVEVTKGIQEHTDSPSPIEEPSNDEFTRDRCQGPWKDTPSECVLRKYRMLTIQTKKIEIYCSLEDSRKKWGSGIGGSLLYFKQLSDSDVLENRPDEQLRVEFVFDNCIKVIFLWC